MRQTDQTAQAYGSLIKCNIVLTLRRGTDGVFAHKDGAFAGKACALFFCFFVEFCDHLAGAWHRDNRIRKVVLQ